MHYTRVRLYRVLANDIFLGIFKDFQVTTLPRTSSDHHPICIKFSPTAPNVVYQPFRFENAFLSHENFLDCVKDSWDPSTTSFQANLIKLSQDLRSWSKTCFGDIYKRKRRVLARLNGIQKSLDKGPNDYLLNLEIVLMEEYNLICFQEETMLKQKTKEPN